MKLLMIDNYDSFTYNIVQYLGELGAEVEVVRNDEVTLAQIGERIAAGTQRLVVSPGPCSPAEARILRTGQEPEARQPLVDGERLQ